MLKEVLVSRILKCSVTTSSRGDPHHLKPKPLLFTGAQTRGSLEVVLLRENTHISVCFKCPDVKGFIWPFDCKEIWYKNVFLMLIQEERFCCTVEFSCHYLLL